MLFATDEKKQNNLKLIRIWMHGLACIVFFLNAANTVWAEESTPSMSEKEKIQLTEQAVDLYKKGDITAARQRFEKVAPQLTENPAVPYYLGLIYYEQGQRADTISQWQRYVAMQPQGANSITIRKYLTLLRHEHAADQAQAAIAREKALEDSTAQAQIITVNTFESKGYSILGPIGKGMAALLAKDLSQIPGVKVVGREQMRIMLDEAATETVGLGELTPEAAGRIGKLLKVEYVASGEIMALDTENMQISVNVFDVNADSEVVSHKVKGPLLGFHALQKKITCDVVSAIGLNCKQLSEEVIKPHTSKLPALVALGWGLDYRDKQRYDKAREMFQKALARDPKFELAEQFLLDTPTAAMARKSPSEVIADLSKSAPDPITTTQTGGKSKWKRNTLYAVGGLAVIAGGAAMAGGSSSPRRPGPPPGNLNGTWFATLTSASDDGQLDFTLSKGDNDVELAQNPQGWSCFNEKGGVDYNQWDSSSVQLTIRSPQDQREITLTGTSCVSVLNNACVSYTGNWSRNFESCNNAPTSGDSFQGGSFTLKKAGSGIY